MKTNITTSYWISPDNKFIPIDLTHIDLIVNNPDKFGLSQEYIQKVHKKHKEQPGDEGNARDEIMTKLIKDGWIRIRNILQYYTLKIQVYDFKQQTIDRVEKAIIEGYKRKIFNKSFSVSILNIKGEDFVYNDDNLIVSGVVSGALSDKKFKSRVETGYTSLARMYHEDFEFLDSIEDYVTKGYTKFSLNELNI
ncbi:MAG: hypothetical protein PHF86_12920 [Candidatus Nanoarchaeia archaeon]|nr:hypothetical protein [Candidatus Nanoarchaeia archaeon]